MPRKRFTEEQIIAFLKRVDAGQRPQDLCREYGISENTYYKWKNKFGGMEVSDARRLRALEDENRRLKHIVADLTLDNQALKALNSKNFLSPK
jgi:putative transposase